MGIARIIAESGGFPGSYKAPFPHQLESVHALAWKFDSIVELGSRLRRAIAGESAQDLPTAVGNKWRFGRIAASKSMSTETILPTH
jgi:hypothetical protein